MKQANSRVSAPAREEARALQRRYPTFSETLQNVLWLLEQEPTLGKRSPDGVYVYRQGRGPGSPGVVVTYRYTPPEIEVVHVEVIG